MADEPVTMSFDDEMPWRPQFPKDRQDFYDDIGFSLIGETDEYNLLLGNFIYNFQGGPKRPRSQWLMDGLVHNNLIIVSRKDERDKPLHDNNFIRTGMNPAEFYDYDDLEVVRSDDSVTWRLGGIEFKCSPPNWHLGGEAGGVTFDLDIRQLPEPVVWSYGKREDAPKAGIGGGYAYVTANGTIDTGSHTFDVRDFRGVHERLVFSEALDNIAQNAGGGKTGFGSAFAVHILSGDVWVWALGSLEEPMFFITVDGHETSFIPAADGSKATYSPLKPWHDPRSGLYMPSEWHIEVESDRGRLELDLSADARGYYPWDLKRGYQIMYWYLCHANGSFTTADGRSVPIRDQLAQHEVVRNIMIHRETLEGPDQSPSW